MSLVVTKVSHGQIRRKVILRMKELDDWLFENVFRITNSGQGRLPCSNDGNRPVLVVLEENYQNAPMRMGKMIPFISINTDEGARDTFGVLRMCKYTELETCSASCLLDGYILQ